VQRNIGSVGLGQSRGSNTYQRMWLYAGVALIAFACTSGAGTSSSVTATSTTDVSPAGTVDPGIASSSTVAQPDPGVACVPGEPRAGIDLRFEDLISFYNERNISAMTALTGEGPVIDPSLEPERSGEYPSVANWLEAAERRHDRLAADGYGFGEPFELFVRRENPSLKDVGVESLFLTLRFWVNQNCEVRVQAGDSLVSAPDPCRYEVLYRPDETGVGCDSPFEPRAGHVGVWTGEEALIYGGVTGSVSVPPLTTGLGFDPDGRSWRSLKPSPEGVSSWPTRRAVWTGTEMIVAGRTPYEDGEELLLMMQYSPSDDEWRVTPFPEGRRAIGAMVWTGAEVIVAGGDLHYPDDQAWAFNPTTRTWRELPNTGLSEVEGIEGVWTGTEAIFVGGYVHPGMTTAAAYNPELDSWRTLTDPPEWIEYHEMVWTGEQVIIYSGNTGPGHRDRLLLYDPMTEDWSDSSAMPIEPSHRLAGVWTGNQLIVWGGYATYGTGHPNSDGAAYDPESDTWTVLSPSPLTPRCDHSGTWTGQELIIFGGMLTCGSPQVLADGNAASYDPATEEWELLKPGP
jgi:hypothetical protein